jgi:hypothetical protein
VVLLLEIQEKEVDLKHLGVQRRMKGEAGQADTPRYARPASLLSELPRCRSAGVRLGSRAVALALSAPPDPSIVDLLKDLLVRLGKAYQLPLRRNAKRRKVVAPVRRRPLVAAAQAAAPSQYGRHRRDYAVECAD